MADAIDVGAERPDALAPHPIPVLHVRMRDRSVCILKPRNECRYLKATCVSFNRKLELQGKDRTTVFPLCHRTPLQASPLPSATQVRALRLIEMTGGIMERIIFS